MKKIYYDRTTNTGCVSIYVQGAEVAPAGTTVYVMSAKENGPEYQRFREEYDIHFLFEGSVPVIDFYTIPQVDIFAVDSRGGFFGTAGGTTDFEGKNPVCYIDSKRNCFYIAEDGKHFLDSLPDWKKGAALAKDISFYSSGREAAKAEEFICSYDSVLNHIEEKYREILGKALTGIYVHGSIAFGCFTWENSDIDFIVVINREIPQRKKEDLIRVLLDLDDKAPPKGLEMSVVLKKYCAPFVYPTPFELHFSNAHKEACGKDLAAYCRSMQGTDRDLAAHFTVIRKAGITIWGEEISSVFGEVPGEAYLDSIEADVADAESGIGENPVYTILNLCRVLAYKKEGLVLSKEQGGQWGIKNLPGEYRVMIQKALRSYRGEGMFSEEENRLQAFAGRMLLFMKEEEKRIC